MNDLNMIEIGAKLGMFFVPFLFALCFHEFAHGWVARRLGDNTAEVTGRLSMNPLVHADPLGTFILPIAAILFGGGFFFGWAKPVPVNARNLRRPKQDMFWVAVAGPVSNILLAVIGTVVLAFALAYGRGEAAATAEAIAHLLKVFITVNLFLALFNLIPVHPLDGGKVIEPFIPYRWNRWLEDNQGSLNMALLAVLLLGGSILSTPVSWAVNHLMYVSVLLSQILPA